MVVGGGVTGCAAALALAEAGLKVRLHEAREISGGASGRNGGFALRGGAAPYDVTVESIGRDATSAYWRKTEQALDRLVGLAGDAARRTGSLRLAADDEERDELAVEYEALRADGFAAEWIDEPLRAAASGRRSSTRATQRCSRRAGCGVVRVEDRGSEAAAKRLLNRFSRESVAQGLVLNREGSSRSSSSAARRRLPSGGRRRPRARRDDGAPARSCASTHWVAARRSTQR